MKLFSLLYKSILSIALFAASTPLMAHAGHDHSNMSTENTVWHAGYWLAIGIVLLLIGTKILLSSKLDNRLSK